MADIVPTTILGSIEFYEQRIAAWAADPDALGLDAQQILEMQGRLAAARAAYNAAQESRQQAMNNTATQKQAVAAMNSYGAGLIAAIRATAELAPDPAAVWDEAEITPPASGGSPLPPPVAATELRMRLSNTGEIGLSWKGTVANGTVYAVYRRFTQGSGYTQIGTSTTKSFVDATVPVGTAEVTYYVVAMRDGLESPPSDVVSLRFGAVEPGGQNGAQQDGGSQLGLAA